MSLVAVLRGDSEDVDVRTLAELVEHAIAEERDDILRMLRRDECAELNLELTGEACSGRLAYIQLLIERVERKEHRR